MESVGQEEYALYEHCYFVMVMSSFELAMSMRRRVDSIHYYLRFVLMDLSVLFGNLKRCYYMADNVMKALSVCTLVDELVDHNPYSGNINPRTKDMQLDMHDGDHWKVDELTKHYVRRENSFLLLTADNFAVFQDHAVAVSVDYYHLNLQQLQLYSDDAETLLLCAYLSADYYLFLYQSALSMMELKLQQCDSAMCPNVIDSRADNACELVMR